MTPTHGADSDSSSWTGAARMFALVVVTLFGLAGETTSVTAQASDEAEDDAAATPEIAMPEGQRILPGPGGMEPLPLLPTFLFSTVEGPEVSDRSVLDARLRATRTDPRLPYAGLH
ncbi:MAG: hypothetical protein ACOC5J_03010, partial [Gemmatimonadota bacterium]